jgi:RNA-binding protein
LVIVGADGLTEAVCSATQVALEDHELVKVRLGAGFTGDRREAAHQLAAATRSALAQLVGRVVVLYRRRARDDAKRPRIVLP